MQAIPKKLLIHKADLYKETQEDRWGNSQETLAAKLTRIRLEPTSKVIRDKNNAEVQLSATLFYDCKYSRPQNIRLMRDDIIDVNGERFKVESIESLYDESKLHHYEVGLIKSASKSKSQI